MSIVFPLALGSIIVIGTIMLYQAYQGLFSSFVMMVLTAISAAIAWNYCEPLGWSLGKWHQEYLSFILLFGGLITLGGLAKSIMRTHRYVRLAIGVAAAVFLIVVSSRAQMAPDTATGNSYGQAVALIGLFVITLLSLRAIVDNAVVGNVILPWQVERSGGAALGFVTGLIVVGMVLSAWQMMPFSPGLLAGGYQDSYGLAAQRQRRPAEISENTWKRTSNQISLSVSIPPKDSWASYNRYNEKMQLQAAPFPYADSFTVGLMKALSCCSLGSQQTFGRVHHDLLLELWANRNGIAFASRQVAPGNAVASAQWRPSLEASPQTGVDKATGILTLMLDYEARDEDGPLRFKGTQVRLVGTSGRSYWPVAIHLDGISWPALYGDLSKLALLEAEGAQGYLRYKAYNDGNSLWAKDEQDQGNIRREIRIHRQEEGLWFQVQLAGPSGNLEMLPTSLGLIRSLKKNEKAVIELIFDIDREDEPDYVVFKRTAMKQVSTIVPEKKASPAPQDSQAPPAS